MKNIGRLDLAEKVVHVAVTEGDGAGYDIRSFDKKGNEIFIEVKTTTKSHFEPFFVTSHELKVSKQVPNKYRLYRVFKFEAKVSTGRLFIEQGQLDNAFLLSPKLYIAKK